ncbi:MAG: amino acid adenylation domain-containing protein [Bacteroidota bacterium]
MIQSIEKKKYSEALIPELSFEAQALRGLSVEDQSLFQLFGKGKKVPLPFHAIHYAIEAQVNEHPGVVAAVHQGKEITYKVLNEQAEKLAYVLKTNGVTKGDRVGLFAKRSIPMLVGIFATLKLGAIYVPQDIGVSKMTRLNYIMDVADIKVVLTLSDFQERVPRRENATTIALDEVMEQNLIVDERHVTDIEVGLQDVCYLLFTSGTTGNPNGVQVTHGNLCNILLTKPGNLGMRPGTKVAQLLNIAFDMAAWEILTCLAHGGTLLIRDKDIVETARQANVIIATPSVLSLIDPAKCPNIEAVAVAGEPCPLSLANKWAEVCNFYNSCGPTETTIVNTMQLCRPKADRITIGTPTPNNTVYILNEKMQPCTIGETGVMWAGGLCVTSGYINNDQKNKERYALDPFLGEGKMMFRTGDLGRWTYDGQLLHLGRMDDQVKVKGFRVELDGVSSVIEGLPNCKRAATIKLDDRNLVSFAMPATVSEEKAKEAVANHLPYYCVPTFVISMEELPMTGRGKIDKRTLLEIAKKYQETGDITVIENRGNHESDQQNPDQPSSGVDSKESLPDPNAVVLPKQKKKWLWMWKGERLMHYNRLIVATLLANIFLFVYGAQNAWWWTDTVFQLTNISYAVLANIGLAILIRQQYVVNILFGIATSVPKSWSLSIRRLAGKVYHFGGIHVGGAIAGTLWFGFFSYALSQHFFGGLGGVSLPTISITYSILTILIAMCVMARPSFRAKQHDKFEAMHRFGGWSSLLLFWAHTAFFINDQTVGINFGQTFFTSIGFWALLIITFSVALPWLRLKKVPVNIDNPSSHVAIAKFNHVTPFAGSSTTLSRHPLKDWHSFANIPVPGESGYRLAISRAGDWTGEFIDDLPTHVWTRGIPTAGVGNIDQIFKRVIWVATGSGIGPCLPHMVAQEVPSRLVWATRNPRKTYGDKLVDEILSVQPDAIIWDTDNYGKPDLVKLAYLAYQEFDAEAIICISNKKLTWQVVEGMESRGIPAYGAIWDS